jgi:hypothetical protein
LVVEILTAKFVFHFENSKISPLKYCRPYQVIIKNPLETQVGFTFFKLA